MVKKGKHTSKLKVPEGLDRAIEHVLRLEYGDSVQVAMQAGLELPENTDISRHLHVSITWNMPNQQFDIQLRLPNYQEAFPVNDFIHGKILNSIGKETNDFDVDYVRNVSATYSVSSLRDFTDAINSMTSPENKIRFFDLGRGI